VEPRGALMEEKSPTKMEPVEKFLSWR